MKKSTKSLIIGFACIIAIIAIFVNTSIKFANAATETELQNIAKDTSDLFYIIIGLIIGIFAFVNYFKIKKK